MPATPATLFRIELREHPEQIMADVLGDKARRRPDGTATHTNLLGDNSTGTGTRLVRRQHGPSRDQMALIGARYAQATGMDPERWTEEEIWRGIMATHRIVCVAEAA
jgi:hypothetical protein